MNKENRHIEMIMLKKAYHELSAEEFLVVKDVISSENEYNDMRAMLLSSINLWDQMEEIEPKKETGEVLMSEFLKTYPARQDRAGGLGFLFPSGKSFYQKPGYQILAVAAMIVLIFTIYPKLSGKQEDGNVALHETSVEEEKFVPTEKKDLNTEPNLSQQFMENESMNEQEAVTETSNQASSGAFKGQNEVLNKEKASDGIANYDISVNDKSKSSDASKDQESKPVTPNLDMEFSSNAGAVADEIIMEETEEEKYKEIASSATPPVMAEKSNNNGETFDRLTDEDDDSYLNESIALDQKTNKATSSQPGVSESNQLFGRTAANKKEAAEKVSVIKKSKSLAENQELIELFYTAM